MARWLNRVRQTFLPWGSSVLLHALILLLLPWLLVLSIPPQTQQAVEVELVGLLPGGGSGSAREGKDQQLGPGAGKREAAPPLRKAVVKRPLVAPPQVPVAAKISPPPAAPKEERKEEPKPVETVVTEQQPELVTAEPPIIASNHTPALDGGKPPSAGEGSPETGVAASTEGDGTIGLLGAAGGGTAGLGTRFSAVPGAGGGVGGGFGRGGDWRQLLRQRIENAKHYPAMARRLGMEGTVHVEFQIARDGSIETLNVVKSSGYPLLDEASVQAIKRAAPLPIVPGKIRVPISYRLHNGR